MEQKVVCKNCSAPLDYRDGDTIAVCIYCNETNKFSEEKVTDEHYCLDLFIEQQNVRSTLVGDLLKIPGVSDNIETGLIIKNMNLIYLPFYITQIHGNVQWKGVGRDAEFSGHDGKGYTNIRFITKKEEGVFDDLITVVKYDSDKFSEELKQHNIAVIGRTFFSQGEIKNKGGKLINEKSDFKKAKNEALKELKKKHGKKLKDELMEIEEKIENYKITKSQLIHVPFWEVEWLEPNIDEPKKALIDAASGITVQADIPSRKLFMIFSYSMVALYLISSIIGGLVLLYYDTVLGESQVYVSETVSLRENVGRRFVIFILFGLFMSSFIIRLTFKDKIKFSLKGGFKLTFEDKFREKMT